MRFTRALLFFIALALSVTVANAENPNNPKKYTYYKTGVANYKSGKYKAAYAQFKLAVQVDDLFMEAYYMMGQTKEAVDAYPAAIEQYTKALAGQPRFKDSEISKATIYRSLGALKYRTKDYEGAKEACDLLIKLTPMDAAAYYYRAFAEYMAGETVLAAFDHFKAVSLDAKLSITGNYYSQNDRFIFTIVTQNPLAYAQEQDMEKIIKDARSEVKQFIATDWTDKDTYKETAGLWSLEANSLSSMSLKSIVELLKRIPITDVELDNKSIPSIYDTELYLGTLLVAAEKISSASETDPKGYKVAYKEFGKIMEQVNPLLTAEHYQYAKNLFKIFPELGKTVSATKEKTTPFLKNSVLSKLANGTLKTAQDATDALDYVNDLLNQASPNLKQCETIIDIVENFVINNNIELSGVDAQKLSAAQAKLFNAKGGVSNLVSNSEVKVDEKELVKNLKDYLKITDDRYVGVLETLAMSAFVKAVNSGTAASKEANLMAGKNGYLYYFVDKLNSAERAAAFYMMSEFVKYQIYPIKDFDEITWASCMIKYDSKVKELRAKDPVKFDELFNKTVKEEYKEENKTDGFKTGY